MAILPKTKFQELLSIDIENKAVKFVTDFKLLDITKLLGAHLRPEKNQI